MLQPKQKPKRPFFSSGPCAKPDVWRLSWLENALLSRSHRSFDGKTRLKEAHSKTCQLLNLPKNYKLAFVAGSATGAFELGLWSLLGPKVVDILIFEHFSRLWAQDIVKQLKIEPNFCWEAPYGDIPSLNGLQNHHDLVFPWTGTASTAKIPLENIAKREEEALTFIDGTAALFCENIDWERCDIFSFSWQKALGSEGAHGTLILSPKAYQRLKFYTPPWPLPRLFRLKEDGEIISSYFEGQTINTPSLLCLEDYIKILNWALSIGGYDALVKKAYENSQIIQKFLQKSVWATALVENPVFQSHSCIAIKIIDKKFNQLDNKEQEKFLTKFHQLLAKENIALDISSYRSAPLGLRIWTGPTIDKEDLVSLCPWLDYAFHFCIDQV